jgi:hypothetical protein
MNSKATHMREAALPDADADIDRFLAEHHDEIAAKLAAGRAQIADGQVEPLEPLDALLRDARAAR